MGIFIVAKKKGNTFYFQFLENERRQHPRRNYFRSNHKNDLHAHSNYMLISRDVEQFNLLFRHLFFIDSQTIFLFNNFMMNNLNLFLSA